MDEFQGCQLLSVVLGNSKNRQIANRNATNRKYEGTGLSTRLFRSQPYLPES
jgi:hypothetical protein